MILRYCNKSKCIRSSEELEELLKKTFRCFQNIKFLRCTPSTSNWFHRWTAEGSRRHSILLGYPNLNMNYEMNKNEV